MIDVEYAWRVHPAVPNQGFGSLSPIPRTFVSCWHYLVHHRYMTSLQKVDERYILKRGQPEVLHIGHCFERIQAPVIFTPS